MNFDYTYLHWMGFIFFEPMVILTNVFMFCCSIYYCLQLNKYKHPYSKLMSGFVLLFGLSALLGAVAHVVHFQLGDVFFRTTLFLMNGISLVSIFYFFRASFRYLSELKHTNRIMLFLTGTWVAVLLLITFFRNEFIIIKIHAGLVLIYSMVVHYISYRKKDSGSVYVVGGILISFLSIIVHSLRFSFHEWFNYKDIAHVIMIISLYYIYKGIKLNSQDLELKSAEV